MHRSFTLLLAGALFALSAAGAGAAQTKDEKNLDKETVRLEAAVVKPDGERAVTRRLEADFKVSQADIQALRDRRLGYGEITVLYSLAQQMPGGITDANIRKIEALRAGPPAAGWGAVAKQVGVKLGSAVSQVRKVTNESHRDRKQEHAAAPAKGPAAPPPAEAAPHRKEPRRPFTGEGKALPQGRAAD